MTNEPDRVRAMASSPAPRIWTVPNATSKKVQIAADLVSHWIKAGMIPANPSGGGELFVPGDAIRFTS